MLRQQLYALWDDINILNRARFSLPMTNQGIDARLALMQGKRWERGPVQVELVTQGIVTQWNYLANSTIPFVTSNVADALSELIGPTFQRIPASFAEENDTWHVLGLSMLDCANGDSRSPLEALSPTINLARVGNTELFRLPSFAVIASARVRDLLIRNGITGGIFREVAASL
jgi:hypothetical protein